MPVGCVELKPSPSCCVILATCRGHRSQTGILGTKRTLGRVSVKLCPSSLLKEYRAIPIPCTVNPAAIPFNSVCWTALGGDTKPLASLVMVMLAPVSVVKIFSSGVKGEGS
jgi:hypothetical protein